MAYPYKNFLRNLDYSGLSTISDPEYTQVSIGLTPFIRENDINFNARNLKPDSVANLFFDDIKVNNFAQRASVVNSASSSILTGLRLNEGLYATTSKAYAEVLGASATGNQNLIYLNENFITFRVIKVSLGPNLTINDYKIGDLIYQTPDNLPFNFNLYTGLTQPNFTFLGTVKRWEVIDSSNGVLVVDPFLGRANTTGSGTTSDIVYNLTRFNAYSQASDTLANNRFQAGETVQYASNSVTAFTVSTNDSYVARSSAVTAANTSNLRSIVISSNNISRDGIGNLVGEKIFIVSGTNMGFSATVTSISSNTTTGWTEAILDAPMPAVPTSNTIYSISNHVVDDVGALCGIFHIPSQDNLRWLTGERVFTITDTATNNDNNYKMRAIAKYTALGRTNTTENARNFVLTEFTAATQQAAPKVIVDSPKINDRKFMAQTFFTPRANEIVDGEVKNAYGIFISSIDLFFKAKPTNNDELLPFTIAISRVVDGLPSNEIIAERTLEPRYINVSNTPSITNLSTITKFTFRDPVYLQPSTEYAIKLITESPEYEVWTATLGEEYTDEFGNLRRISEQPYIGNFFKSQNASNWNPILNQDLMFRVNRASFSTAPSSVFFNLEPKLFAQVVGLSTNTVFDQVKISSTEQQFSPTNITYEIKTVLTDGTETDYIKLNNNEIYNFGKDTDISSVTSKRRRLINAANVNSVNVRVTLQTSDDSVSPVLNRERFSLFTLQNIINNAGISNNLITIINSGNHSNAANIAVTFSVPDVGGNRATGNVTPALLVGGKVKGINITNPGSGYFTTPSIIIAEGGASSNAAAVIAGETDAFSGGNILSKYQTKIVVLDEGFDAGDLVVRLDAIKPSGTDIQVYFKVLSALDSEPFTSKNWERMTKVADYVSPDQTKSVPLEYKYSLTKGSIEYFDGTRIMPLGGTFKYFAVKICLIAEDPTVPPVVNSMRAVAVPGG
jgi:hypothetical protein